MKKILWVLPLTVALLLPGCQTKPPSAPGTTYPFGELAAPSVDHELAFFRDRVAKNPHSYVERASLAGAYIAKAQFSGDASFFLLAEQTAQESLKIQPTPGAALVLASVNEARHEFEKSLEQARAVYDQDPVNLDAISIMSSSLLELGRLQEAEKYSVAIAKSFPNAASIMQVGRAKMNMGQDEEARTLLFQALQLEQADERKVSARIRSLLGEMELRSGHPQAAEAYFKAALVAHKTHYPALLGLAKLAERAGHRDEAVQWFTTAFSYTQNPAYLTEVADLKAKNGDKQGAEELRKKAESLLRPSIEKKQFGHARDLARILLDRGDPASVKEAVQILEGERQQRGDVRLYEILGEAYAAAGSTDLARAAYQKAISTGLREPSLWARMAQLEEKSGHAEEAKADWAKAHAWDPAFQADWLER